MVRSNRDVRFTPESRHSSARFGCPLWAINGHPFVFVRPPGRRLARLGLLPRFTAAEFADAVRLALRGLIQEKSAA
jgi:hypothetical protein